MSFIAGTVARAALILFLFNIVSKLTALLREMLIARQFGVTDIADAYFVAFTFPSVLFYLFTGALATVVVPIYSEYAAQNREREAWRLFGTLFCLLLLLLIVVTGLGLLAAPVLVKLLAPQYSGYIYDLTVSLTRWMFPLLIFSGLAALFSGLLNARNVFAITALNGPLSNLGVIVAILLLSSQFGIYGMAIGVLVGGFAGAAVQLPALFRAGFTMRPGVPFNHPDLKRIFKLILPMTLAYSISETYVLIDRYLASGLAEKGSIAALNYANKLIQMPLGLFVTVIGTAVFPALTRLSAAKDWRGLGEGILRSLRLVLLLCVPAAVLLLVLRDPLITVFYKAGVFDDRAALLTSIALFFYAFGLAGQAGEFILARGFFALQDTRTPMLLSAFAVLLNLGLSLALIGYLQHGGLALASSIAALTNMSLFIFFLNRRLGGKLWNPGMWRFIVFVLAAALAMGGSIELLSRWFDLDGVSNKLLLLVRISLVGLGGLLVYLAALMLLRIDEVRQIYHFVKERLLRKGIS